MPRRGLQYLTGLRMISRERRAKRQCMMAIKDTWQKQRLNDSTTSSIRFEVDESAVGCKIFFGMLVVD